MGYQLNGWFTFKVNIFFVVHFSVKTWISNEYLKSYYGLFQMVISNIIHKTGNWNVLIRLILKIVQFVSDGVCSYWETLILDTLQNLNLIINRVLYNLQIFVKPVYKIWRFYSIWSSQPRYIQVLTFVAALVLCS